ncbi:MAG: HAD hydrolase-like protein, partial [Polaromonas sp.]
MVDTLGDFVAALNLTLADLLAGHSERVQLDAPMVERMVGKGSEHLIRSMLKFVQGQMSSAQPAIDLIAKYEFAYTAYQRHYTRINGLHSAVYPGVLEGLEALLQSGLQLACLTNKPLGFARELLKLKNLDGFFTEVFGGDSFERKKPDPLPLLKTCECLGTSPA